MYKITKLFTGGILKGMLMTERTYVKFEKGFSCKRPIAGSPYIIVRVEEEAPLARTLQYL